MANLYTSSLITYSGADPIEVSVTEFTHDQPTITVEHYTSGDVLIGEIVPAESCIENHDSVNTRMRIKTASGQVAVGEKIKIIVDE